ncbi:hypothetical protein P170DRAFT_199225 [Aspergillus steynii IBT 23096]|uniref:Uncharacterized protein n=1 Tax=Aspergillus steynii IBT 23096 TaxID=1392250 RepID=A0A2I2G4V4_9EURO|nr:uncharacterized protein P170DRAFT_199225 [Aspergillus steynii IBT 23096]PLB47883.1 hypothetical protein P170DRAFT_199225 [Aspergillus steynii IBT 23096]
MTRGSPETGRGIAGERHTRITRVEGGLIDIIVCRHPAREQLSRFHTRMRDTERERRRRGRWLCAFLREILRLRLRRARTLAGSPLISHVIWRGSS